MGAAPKIEEIAALPQPKSTSLLGRQTDLLMIGGASIATCIGFHLFTDQNADLFHLSMMMYYLSMVVNWPHFMVSYQLLYWDRRRELFSKTSYLWAGFLVPVLLVGLMAWGFMRKDDVVFSMLVQVMYLTVGWHYVKQIFGTLVVTSAAENYFLKPDERRAILTNLYSLWALSFLSGHETERTADFFGVQYVLVGVPPDLMKLCYVAVAATGLWAGWKILNRYFQEGRLPSTAGLVSYLTLYVWYLPFVGHRHFFYVIPFFHSLQYLLFVFALKKNQWAEQVTGDEVSRRKRGLMHWTGYFGASFAVGMLVFLIVPNHLDGRMAQWNPEAADIWGATIFMALFQLFINVHHYFIDNVIWKKDNPDLKRYLFRRD